MNSGLASCTVSLEGKRSLPFSAGNTPSKVIANTECDFLLLISMLKLSSGPLLIYFFNKSK